MKLYKPTQLENLGNPHKASGVRMAGRLVTKGLSYGS